MALPDFQVEIVTGGALPDFRVAVVAENAVPRPDYHMVPNVGPRLPDYRVAVVAENAVPRPDFRVWGLVSNLGDLGVNPASITENSAPGAIVGAVTGAKPGSTITITGTAGSRFALSGGNVVAGATSTDYETATSHQITLRETNADYDNSPKDTVITIQVADVDTLLSALTLSAASIEENSAAGTVVGTIQGKASGSTLTMTDTAGGRFALGVGADAGKVVAGSTGTDYETATTHNITLRETLGESSNSPRNTVLAIAVSDVVSEIPEANLLLDFQNGVYRKDGTTGSLAAIGGVVTGAPSITGAGLLNATGESVSIGYDTTGDLIIVVDYAIPPMGTTQRMFRYGDADNNPFVGALLTAGNAFQGECLIGFSNAQGLGAIAGSSKIATGYSSGSHKSSKNGGAVVTTVFGSPAPTFAPGTMVVGNITVSGADFWNARIRSVAIYKGTFTDAQIQALSA